MASLTVPDPPDGRTSMRIGGVGARPAAATDVAAALSGAVAQLGQRPAITALGPHGRHEQGFVSLAGWAAKGANLLRDEIGLTSGDRLGVASPPGWPLAAVTLAAWWLGVAIVPAATPDLPLYVRHVALPGGRDAAPDGASGGDVLWIGDLLDGTGVTATAGDECWTDAVIPHPDRAPAPVHDGALAAVDLTPDAASSTSGPGATATQAQLLGAAAEGAGGVLGILRHGDADLLARPDAIELLTALVLRPLVTGAASVVAADDDVARERISADERVTRWIV